MSELHLLTATETLARIAAGTTSAHEVGEAIAAAVAAREPVLRAFAWRDGPPALGAGPLAGVQVGVKDVLDVAGMPAQYGSPAWDGHRPRADAACVALARRAGLGIAGKTVTTEFATRHPGPTTNPWNPRHSPGGSSSGSAAGVAAGFFHLAFATQTAGSIIRPAAYCGVHGFKPAFGTLHRAGMKVMSESLDTIGLLARSLDDIALGMTALTGRDHGRPSEALPAPPRLLWCAGPGRDIAAAHMLALLDRAVEAARGAGAEVAEWALPAEFAEAQRLHAITMNIEVAQALAWEWDAARALLSDGLRERCAEALDQPGERVWQGRAAFARARAAFAAQAGWDAVVTLAAADEAPEGLEWTGDPACNALWTALHAPCVSVPAGRGPGGLPVALQVVGWDDVAVLKAAAWLEGVL